MSLNRQVRLLALLGLAACTRDAPPTGSNGGPPPARITPQSLLVWRDSQVVSWSRPVFDSHAVYFLGVHTAYGVDKTTGASLWTTRFTYPFDPGVLQGYGTAIAAGLVIMGDIDVFGLDPQSGAVAWRFAPRQTFPQEREFQRLTTDGTTVYCGGVWGNVYAVDAATGVQRWIAHVTTLPDSVVRVFNPVLANGVVYVAFTDDQPSFSTPATGGAGGVAAIDAGSGRLLWSTYLPYLGGNPSTEARNVAVTGTRIITGTNNGFVFGLDPLTGAILDTVPESAGIYSFAAVDTRSEEHTSELQSL
jgi:outer membrane protein assembly factor BamB